MKQRTKGTFGAEEIDVNDRRSTTQKAMEQQHGTENDRTNEDVSFELEQELASSAARGERQSKNQLQATIEGAGFKPATTTASKVTAASSSLVPQEISRPPEDWFDDDESIYEAAVDPILMGQQCAASPDTGSDRTNRNVSEKPELRLVSSVARGKRESKFQQQITSERAVSKYAAAPAIKSSSQEEILSSPEDWSGDDECSFIGPKQSAQKISPPPLPPPSPFMIRAPYAAVNPAFMGQQCGYPAPEIFPPPKNWLDVDDDDDESSYATYAAVDPVLMRQQRVPKTTSSGRTNKDVPDKMQLKPVSSSARGRKQQQSTSQEPGSKDSEAAATTTTSSSQDSSPPTFMLRASVNPSLMPPSPDQEKAEKEVITGITYASRGEAEPQQQRRFIDLIGKAADRFFGILDIPIVLVFGIVLYLVDIGSDIWAAVVYFQEGHQAWGSFTISFVALSALSWAAVSWSWWYYDRDSGRRPAYRRVRMLLAILLLDPLVR